MGRVQDLFDAVDDDASPRENVNQTISEKDDDEIKELMAKKAKMQLELQDLNKIEKTDEPDSENHWYVKYFYSSRLFHNFLYDLLSIKEFL